MFGKRLFRSKKGLFKNDIAQKRAGKSRKI